MDLRILSPTSTERLLDRLEKLTSSNSTAPSTTSSTPVNSNKPRRKIRKRKDKSTASSSSKSHHHHHHHHHHHQAKQSPAVLNDIENTVPRSQQQQPMAKPQHNKQKSMVRLSVARPMRNEAMFARTPEVASEDVEATPKPKKAVAFVSTPLGSKNYIPQTGGRTPLSMPEPAVIHVDDHEDDDEEEEVVVVTDSKRPSRQGSNMSASRSVTSDPEAASADDSDDNDDDDDGDVDGYKTTLLDLAFAGMDGPRTRRSVSKKRERAAGVTLPSSTPTIAITPAVATTTTSAPPAPTTEAGEAQKVVTVSLAAYSAMQNEANELRTQVASLQKEVMAQNTTIETMSLTMQEMQAELARARQATKQAAVVVPPAPPAATAAVEPPKPAVVEKPAPVAVVKAKVAAASAPADAVSNMLRSSHATKVRETAKPRTSLPKPGKVEGLRTFWKEKASIK